jgi:hypothetical protein
MFQLKNIIIATIFFVLWSSKILALDTTANKITCFTIQIQQDKPIMDYGKRFGWSNRAGASIYKKTSANFIFGARFDFIFGSNILEDSLLQNLSNTTGGVTSINGLPTNVGLYQRGYQVGLDFGRILPIFQANKNSGPLLLTSIGFMQHKINIFDKNNELPQLTTEYKKGYDRLTNGLYIEQLIGYSYFSKSKSANFYAGLNFNYASTAGRREWLFDVRRTGADKRNDATVGVRFGWIIPLYARKVEDKYY